MKELKAYIQFEDDTFEDFETEQIYEYIETLLDRMEYNSSKNGYPIQVGLIHDEGEDV